MGGGKGDERERQTETERERLRRDRLTDRSLSYRMQGSDCTCWRQRETQRDKTDRDHYHTGCKGLTVPAGAGTEEQ